MEDVQQSVETEIDDHKADIDMWLVTIATLPIPESRKGAADRFVRDCKIFSTDLDTKETLSMSDLVDFSDRRKHLDDQYTTITSDLQ